MNLIPTVTAQELEYWKAAGTTFTLLDIREEGDWRDGHLGGAIHIPISSLEFYATKLIPNKEQLVVPYCNVGRTSVLAAEILYKLGYKKIMHLEGGYQDAKDIIL